MNILKICKCGQVFNCLPEHFVVQLEEPGGVYWQCECRSTQFLPFEDLRKFNSRLAGKIIDEAVSAFKTRFG